MTDSTTVSLRDHHDAVLAERTRRYDERRAADLRFAEERDRRYAEVAAARAEALKIKEQADRDALQLAREIQVYKDEKANELRSQIERERVTYATKDDLKAAVEKIEVALTPLVAYASTQQGRGAGLHAGWGYLVGAVGLFLTLLTIGGILFTLTR